jgi:hypothetical protein
MAYSNKHGVPFPFTQHIDIHDQVLKKFEPQMAVPQEYSIDYETTDKSVIKHSVEFIFNHNHIKVKIEKKSKITYKRDKQNIIVPCSALTIWYNYVARSSKYNLRYCSPHTDEFDPINPWHNKHHRHESTGKTSEEISVFDDDNRPSNQRSSNKYHVHKKTITLKYLGQVDWPNVKEFLREVSKLS